MKDHAYSANALINTKKNTTKARKKRLTFESDKENLPANIHNVGTDPSLSRTEVQVQGKQNNGRIEELLDLVTCNKPRMQMLPSHVREQLRNVYTIDDLCTVCMKTEILKCTFHAHFVAEIRSSVASMSALKHGPGISLLSKFDYEDLTQFSWSDVLDEMARKQTTLAQVLCAVCMPVDSQSTTSYSETTFIECSPRIGMIYSMIMQSRHHYLSRVQRIIAHCLQESTCDRKVL